MNASSGMNEMLIVLSPAKTLDFEKQKFTKRHSQPIFLDDSATLIDCLRQYSARKLADLMGMGDDLARQTHERFAEWSRPFTPANAKQAALAFRGPAFVGLDAGAYSAKDFRRAQGSLRILSGLHGILKPLDLIQPYRLEMATRLTSPRGKNLYEFWGNRITEALNADLEKMKQPVLVNLASQEYFKTVKAKLLDAPVFTLAFKENRNGTFKAVSAFSKKARGLMASYIIQNGLGDVDDVKAFDVDGYRYHAKLSSTDEYVFTRTSPG